MIAKTTYKPGDAGPLVRYISQDGGRRVPVRDHMGRDLDREEIREFVEESRRHGMERHVIVAPDPAAEYSVGEVNDGVRNLMREWREDRQRTRYVYAVHDSQDTPHAHAVLTGPESQLRMDKQDLRTFRDLARETFAERKRLARRQATPIATAEAAAEATRTADRELSAHHAPDPSTPDVDQEREQKLPDREVDPSPEPEREIDWGVDR